MAFVGPSWTWLAFITGMFLAGEFSGLLNAALRREAVATVPEGEGALGSGHAALITVLVSALGGLVALVLRAPCRPAPPHTDEPVRMRFASEPD
jgi:hypothetical protein